MNDYAPAPSEPIAAEAFWRHGIITPSRDDQNRRATDASKLTFPLQMVIAIVSVFLSAFGGAWVALSSRDAKVAMIESKIDTIQQRLVDNVELDKMKAQLDAAERKSIEMQIINVKEAIAATKAQEQLNGIDIGNLRREVSQGVRR